MVGSGRRSRRTNVRVPADAPPRTFMPDKVRIALDAMGGDVGPAVIVPGAQISLERHPGIEFLMFGDRLAIEPLLEQRPSLKAASRVVHTDVSIAMNAKPSQAL